MADGNQLDIWALQKAITDTADALAKLGKITKEQADAIKKGDLPESTEELDEHFKDLDKELGDFEQSISDATDATEQSTKGTKKTAKSAVTLKKAMLAASAAGASFLVYTVATLSHQLTLASDLNSAGMNLSSTVDGIASGMATFQNSAKTAVLTTAELVELQKEYGVVLNRYGIQQFAKVSKSFYEDVSDMGLTTREAAGYVAEYLEGQRLLGIRSNLDSAEDRARMAQSFEEFDKWGKVLGKSRSELLKQSNALREQVDVAAFLSSAGRNAQESFKLVSAAFAEVPQLMQSLSEGLAAPIAQQSELYKSLAAAQSPAAAMFLQMHETLKRGGKLSQQSLSTFANMIGESNEDVARLMSQAGESGALTAIVQAKIAAETMKRHKNLKGEMADQAAEAAKVAKVREAYTALTTAFMNTIGGILSDPNIAASIERAMKAMTRALEGIVPVLISFTTAILESIAAVSDVILNIGSWWNDTLEGGAGAILDPLKDLFGNKVPNAIMASIALMFTGGMMYKLFKGIISTMTGGRSSAKGGKALGGAAGGILSGLGKGTATAIASIGSALAAVGKVGHWVVAGGLALGAAIGGFVLALGAGASASMALLNLTLPAFAESLRKFENIDTEGLKDVGFAIITLAGGIAAMGAGGFVNALTNIGTGILGFFGSSMTEKLEEFAKISPKVSGPLKALGNSLVVLGPNMEAFGKGLDSLSAYDSTGLKQFTNDVDVLVDSLNSLSTIHPISFGPGTNLTIGEKSIIQISKVPRDSVSTPGPSVADTPQYAQSTSSQPSNEINMIMQEQLKVLTNIATSSTMQTAQLKQLNIKKQWD